jgi:hypothetical protein
MKIYEPFGEFFAAAAIDDLHKISEQDLDDYLESTDYNAAKKDECEYKFAGAMQSRSLVLLYKAVNTLDRDAALKASTTYDFWHSKNNFFQRSKSSTSTSMAGTNPQGEGLDIGMPQYSKSNVI